MSIAFYREKFFWKGLSHFYKFAVWPNFSFWYSTIDTPARCPINTQTSRCDWDYLELYLDFTGSGQNINTLIFKLGTRIICLCNLSIDWTEKLCDFFLLLTMCIVGLTSVKSNSIEFYWLIVNTHSLQNDQPLTNRPVSDFAQPSQGLIFDAPSSFVQPLIKKGNSPNEKFETLTCKSIWFPLFVKCALHYRTDQLLWTTQVCYLMHLVVR